MVSFATIRRRTKLRCIGHVAATLLGGSCESKFSVVEVLRL